MIGELYNSLRSAGAEDEKAKKAASEVAGYENRIGELKTDIIGVRGELALVKWMLGFNIAMTVALVGKALLSPH